MALMITVILMLTALAQEVQCDATFRDITSLESKSEYRAEVLESATPAAVMFTTHSCWKCDMFEGPFAHIGAQHPDNPFYTLNIVGWYITPVGRNNYNDFPAICIFENGEVIHGVTGLSLSCVKEALNSEPCLDGSGAVVPFTPEVCDDIATTD